MEESDKNNSKKTREDVEGTQLLDEIITQHILTRLPPKPLIRCKLISKQWNFNVNFFLDYIKQSIYSDPFTPIETLFIQSGKTFYLYTCNNHDNDDVEVEYVRTSQYNLVELKTGFRVARRESIGCVGSCNGLICLGEMLGKYFILWNPEINQFHRYYFEFLEQNSRDICWGFGYVSSLDDYKVVRISQFRFRAKIDSVHVFSLRTNTWSRIEFGIGECRLVGRSRLVNETLYWRKEDDNDNGDVQIVSFDLGLETFAMFTDLAIRAPENATLCIMGGCLSVGVRNSDDDLVTHVVKRPGRVVKGFYSDLRDTVFDDLIGLTEAGKIFVVYPRCWVPCLVVSSSMKSIVTFETNENLGSTYMASYVPSQISPLPPVECGVAQCFRTGTFYAFAFYLFCFTCFL
ncbi:F-box/kelch-repeat protein At3g23880-like [Chenopodium quinoa]|uniref:F-box/kelch-repeat protein At3g23880-like n=1 Tax=Chenopodium quinoa TaxID=63459 RepID=UPI000B78BA4C|nr:F-box/kelch-repeat protein At3g23880-like [Chenopodium quinoa]